MWVCKALQGSSCGASTQHVVLLLQHFSRQLNLPQGLQMPALSAWASQQQATLLRHSLLRMQVSVPNFPGDGRQVCCCRAWMQFPTSAAPAP